MSTLVHLQSSRLQVQAIPSRPSKLSLQLFSQEERTNPVCSFCPLQMSIWQEHSSSTTTEATFFSCLFLTPSTHTPSYMFLCREGVLKAARNNKTPSDSIVKLNQAIKHSAYTLIIEWHPWFTLKLDLTSALNLPTAPNSCSASAEFENKCN